MSKKNWRIRQDIVEILRSDTGEWEFPGCCTGCAYCGCCLGCIRKFYRDATSRKRFHCDKSPDGNHHWDENVEEEREEEERRAYAAGILSGEIDLPS